MPHVLIVTTSHAELGDSGHKTGLWAEELATPYYMLRDAGADISLASMRGGPIPFDPRSLPAEGGQGPGEKPEEEQEVAPSVRRLLADAEVFAAMQATPSIEDVQREGFDAIFLPGGHGVMWDLPENETLSAILAQADAAGRIIAAVCHGPAGLVSTIRADGRPLVEGRRVSAFTNSEESGVGLTGTVPFLLEDRLVELGGRFERAPDWEPFAVRDGNLITGQNPQSSEAVARLLLEALTGSSS